MTKKTWSKVGITIGVLFMLGALGGFVQVVRVAGWDDQEFFRGFVLGGAVLCAAQFTGGTVLFGLGICRLKGCSVQNTM